MAPPPSPAVYRRRRIVVFGGLILVIVLLVWGVVALVSALAGGGDPEPVTPTTPSPTVSGTPSPAPSATTETPEPEDTGEAAPEQPAVAPCQAADVEVVPVTDLEAYPAGTLPQLSIQLTNRGSADCTLNVGSSTQSLTVTSGNDTWWRSTDCQESPSDMVVTLTAGQTVSSAEPVVWDRTRSSVDTCAAENRPQAPGGGASYHVRVAIGGFESDVSRQIFLE